MPGCKVAKHKKTLMKQVVLQDEGVSITHCWGNWQENACMSATWEYAWLRCNLVERLAAEEEGGEETEAAWPGPEKLTHFLWGGQEGIIGSANVHHCSQGQCSRDGRRIDFKKRRAGQQWANAYKLLRFPLYIAVGFPLRQRAMCDSSVCSVAARGRSGDTRGLTSDRCSDAPGVASHATVCVYTEKCARVSMWLAAAPV